MTDDTENSEAGSAAEDDWAAAMAEQAIAEAAPAAQAQTCLLYTSRCV